MKKKPWVWRFVRVHLKELDDGFDVEGVPDHTWLNHARTGQNTMWKVAVDEEDFCIIQHKDPTHWMIWRRVPDV